MKLYLVLLFTLCSGGLAFSAEVDASEEVKPEEPSILERIIGDDGLVNTNTHDLSLAPVVGSTPTTGLILGGGIFLTPKEEKDYEINTVLVFSLEGFYFINFQYDNWITPRVAWGIETSTTNFIDAFYGEGNETEVDDKVEISQNKVTALPKVTYEWSDELSTSVFFDVRSRQELGARRAEDENEDFDSDLRFFEDETTTGIGISGSYDLRDNPKDPRTGEFYELSATTLPAAMSTLDESEDSLLIQGEFRIFRPVLEKSVLAFRIIGGHAWGDPSYVFRFSLGGRNTLRGYHANRFRGNKFYLLQYELRFPIWKYISGIGFLEYGDIADTALDDPKTAGGGGLRIGLPPSGAVKMRFDFGIGEDQTGLFVSFGQVF